MFKNFIKTITILFLVFWTNIVFWDANPTINCVWLPGCNGSIITTPKSWQLSDNLWKEFIVNVTWYLVQIVSVIAVFALIFSWVMYLVSAWDEEKVWKAKKWIIWSLVGVILSISAWGIIAFINNIEIHL